MPSRKFVTVDLSHLERFRAVYEADMRGTGAGPIRMAIRQWGHRYRGFAQARFDRYSKGGGDWAPLRSSTLSGRRFGRGRTIGGARKSARGQLSKATAASKRRAKYGKRDTAKVRRAKKALAQARREKATGRAEKILARLNKIEQAASSASILRDTGTLFAALAPTLREGAGAIQRDIPFGILVGYGGPHRHPEGRATIADVARFHHSGLGHNPKREIIVKPDATTISAMAADMQRGIDRAIRGTQ